MAAPSRGSSGFTQPACSAVEPETLTPHRFGCPLDFGAKVRAGIQTDRLLSSGSQVRILPGTPKFQFRAQRDPTTYAGSAVGPRPRAGIHRPIRPGKTSNTVIATSAGVRSRLVRR